MDQSSGKEEPATDKATEIDDSQWHKRSLPTPQSSISGSGPKAIIGSEDWHRARHASHKEVERSRRETINEGINELAKIVPGDERNKGAILSRAVAYITELQLRAKQLSEQKSRERSVLEQAINELMTRNEEYKERNSSLESEIHEIRDAQRSFKADKDMLSSRLVSLERDRSELRDRLMKHIREQEEQRSISNPSIQVAHKSVDMNQSSVYMDAQAGGSGPTATKKSASIESEVYAKKASSSDYPSNAEREACPEMDKTKRQISTGDHLELPGLSPPSDIHTPKSTTNATTDTGLSSSEGSEASRMSDLDVKTRNFVSSLSQRIARRCLDFHLSGVRQHTETSAGSSGASTQQLPGVGQENALSSTQRRRKRRNNEDDDQNHERNEGPPGKRRAHVTSDSKRFWACPYTKFDPVRYSEHNRQDEKKYRKCPSAMLKDISKLKQHLRRTHLEPSNYCGNCYESFESKSDLRGHNRANCTEQPPKYQEMMVEAQYDRISTNLPNTEASWYWIYGILFEGATRPASPYVTKSNISEIHEFIEMFRIIGPQAFLRLVHEGLQRDPESLRFNVPIPTVIEETYEAAFPEYLEQLRLLSSGNLLTNETEDSSSTARRVSSTTHDHRNQTTSGEDFGPTFDQFGVDTNPEAESWIYTPSIIHEGFRLFAENQSNDLNIEESEDVWGEDLTEHGIIS